jgi:hypothetical protein
MSEWARHGKTFLEHVKKGNPDEPIFSVDNPTAFSADLDRENVAAHTREKKDTDRGSDGKSETRQTKAGSLKKERDAVVMRFDPSRGLFAF